MNISLKLKHTELKSLLAEMDRVINVDECNTRHEALIGVLMLKFYVSLQRKCAMLEPRDYRLVVTPENAIAFVIYFTSKPVNPVSHGGNIIQKMIAQFDQQTINYPVC
jgi:hypothetical protein